MTRPNPPLILVAAIGAITAAWGAAAADGVLTVSQAGRAFAPGALSVPEGTRLRIVNDDRFVHNVHSKTDGFDLDTKAQRPGEGIDVYFQERGYYELGCKIHPKMKLAVTVE